MAVKSSSKAVRDMKLTVQRTVKGIQGIQVKVQSAAKPNAEWNDAQSKQYEMLMKRVAKLTQTPLSTLNASLPKLEKLALALEKYEKTKI